MKLDFLLQSGKKAYRTCAQRENIFTVCRGSVAPAASTLPWASSSQRWPVLWAELVLAQLYSSSCLVSQLQGCSHSLLGVGEGQQNVKGSGENVMGTFALGKS